MDLYNVTNANTILGVNTKYGPAWLAPTIVLGGRLLKFGGQIDSGMESRCQGLEFFNCSSAGNLADEFARDLLNG